MVSRIRQVIALGQAIWLDYLSRELLQTGRLRELINEGISGVTTNPSILQQAIASGSSYDEQIRELARAGRSAREIYEALVVRDVGEAADQLRAVYNEKNGRDGFVSLEVDPHLAHDTEGTVAEARRLFKAIGRPNVLIKVPATPEGLPAIRTLIGEGINVNVTLIFAIPVYEQVMQAYLEGLRELEAAGRTVRLLASVASFFVSRIDTAVDRLLAERIQAGDQRAVTLRGQAAVASAKVAYDRFKAVFESETFASFRAAGARIQRPLWASTSTKNPDYPDTKYVEELIGPNTVNTMPPHTLDALRDHGLVARTIDLDVDEAYGVLERLGSVGIDLRQVTADLLAEGVRLFAESFDRMLADIEAKRLRFAR